MANASEEYFVPIVTDGDRPYYSGRVLWPRHQSRRVEGCRGEAGYWTRDTSKGETPECPEDHPLTPWVRNRFTALADLAALAVEGELIFHVEQGDQRIPALDVEVLDGNIPKGVKGIVWGWHCLADINACNETLDAVREGCLRGLQKAKDEDLRIDGHLWEQIVVSRGAQVLFVVELPKG